MTGKQLGNYPYFIGNLNPDDHPNGWFSLEEDLFFLISATQFVHVPAGALWNGATIPLIAQMFGLERFDVRYNKATALHDALVGENGQPLAFLYTLEVPLTVVEPATLLSAIEYAEYRTCNWRESAKIFRAAMAVEGSEDWREELYYQAVMAKKRPKYWYKAVFG